MDVDKLRRIRDEIVAGTDEEGHIKCDCGHIKDSHTEWYRGDEGICSECGCGLFRPVFYKTPTVMRMLRQILEALTAEQL